MPSWRSGAVGRVDEERLRIAREVHDTLAHAIAIINVQAGVTAHVLDKRPDRAREALETIEQTSSRALREMRAILGVLRGTDDSRVPYAGLDQISDLVAKARAAGLDVDFEMATLPPQMPVAVGGAVYRIVQESVTNVFRHVGPSRVTVVLDCRADTVEVRVVDDGPRHGPRAEEAIRHRPGSGISGMRERCQVLGGELDVRPRAGGGFAVTARLPLIPAATASA